MSRSQRRCRDARRVLPYVDGVLPTEEALRFEEHLALCESCRAAVEAQRALEEALLALPRPSLLALDRARLLEGIAQRAAERRAADAVAPARRRRVAAWLAAAAAALALALTALRAPGPRPALKSAEAPNSRSGAPETEVETATDEPPGAAAPEASFDAPAVSGAVLVAARDELARSIRRLCLGCNVIANDDLLTGFLAAIEPLRAARVPVAPVFFGLLTDPDPALASATADLLARGIRDGELAREAVPLAPRLEDVMRRPERGAAILPALVALDTPRAWEGVVRAARLPHVRPLALRALAAKGEPCVLAPLQAELLEAAKGEPGLVREVLAALRVRSPAHLKLLSELLRGGVENEPVAAALKRGGAASIELLALGLADPAQRRDALPLASLVRDDALVDPLAALAARGDPAPLALDALARLGSARSLTALFALCADPSASNSRARRAGAAFAVALGHCKDLASALAAARASLPERQDLLVELCRLAPGSEGRAARIALLSDLSLQCGARARIALELVSRREPVEPALIVALLCSVAARREAAAGGDGLAAPLLLLLYAARGEEGLEEGLRALGLDLPRSRLERLRDAARRVVEGGGARRELARVDDLLPIAP